MARKSFLDRVSPNRARSKLIAWPFPAEGEAPKVRIKVLGAHELEAAHLATVAYFRGRKLKVASSDGAFVAREHVELVWLAYADEEGQPLTPTAEDLAREPAEIIAELYAEWSGFQGELVARQLSQSELDGLIDELKKNTPQGLLGALPSIWLRQLITGLVAQPAASITESEPG